MNKICVCGHFANGIKSYNGQTIKTINVATELEKKYYNNRIIKIDTYNWKKKPFKLLIRCIECAKISEHIIILPAQNSLKILLPFFVILKKIYNFKIHYIIIGSWLYENIKNNKFMQSILKKVEYIYAENNNLIKKLNSIGIYNTYQMNNFKNLCISNHKYLVDENNFNCCIFSRIERKKGICDAIYVVGKLNKNNSNVKIKLDIYGKIENSFASDFFKIVNKNKDFVTYCGVVEPEESVNVIEKYNLLLFPTQYYTEGIPGTIIDAYFAGVPVLSSKWENYDEVIIDNKTGFYYKFNDLDDFYDKMYNIIGNKRKLINMSDNCKIKAQEYLPQKAMKIIYRNIGD